MLVGLLPGIRELRTPLAAGYLLLASLYLGLVDRFETPTFEASSLARAAVDAFDLMGSAAAVASATFVAYVAGSVWVDTVPPIIRFVTDTVQARLDDRLDKSLRSSTTREQVGKIVARRLEDSVRFGGADDQAVFETKLADATGATLSERLAQTLDLGRHVDEVTNDYRKVPALILGKEQEIWSMYDRLRSECEFRLGVGTSLVPLAVTMAVKYSDLWGFVVIGSVILWFMGRQKYQAARNILLENMLAGRIKVDSFEKLSDPRSLHWQNDARSSASVE